MSAGSSELGKRSSSLQIAGNLCSTVHLDLMVPESGALCRRFLLLLFMLFYNGIARAWDTGDREVLYL